MQTSHRHILRASSIIAGASILTILFGLVRVKLAAVLLGAAGIGLIGLLQNVLQVAGVIGGLNLQIVGARHIASADADEDPLRLGRAKRTLAMLVTGLALVTGAVFWLARTQIARLVLDNAEQAPTIGWLTIGVMLSIGLGYQTAVLTGQRKMGDVARSNIVSGLSVTLVALAALFLFREQGILLFVLATPVCTFLVGHYFVRRHRVAKAAATGWRKDMTGLVLLGASLTVATLVSILGQLLVKVLIQRHLGLAAVGHFQAAWYISVTYVGFILLAMQTDFFPRLTAHADDKVAACRIINEQTGVALLLAAPILVAMLALSPLVISLLYSSDFVDAGLVLRWQILADVLKIMGWPLGLVLVAFGDGRRFFIAEATTVAVLVGATAALLPYFGLEAGGLSVLLMSLWYLPLVYILVQRHLPFRWTKDNLRLFGGIAVLCSAIFVLTLAAPLTGAIIGCFVSFGMAAFALYRLESALPTRIASFVRTTRERLNLGPA